LQLNATIHHLSPLHIYKHNHEAKPRQHPLTVKMKISIKSSTIFLAGVSTLTGTTLAAECILQSTGVHRWIVKAGTASDISGICGALWDNLKRFSQCSASASFCGARGTDNHIEWEFTAPSICNGGMVESTWWEATRNNLGGIDCP
jgi:hypothetical protein